MEAVLNPESEIIARIESLELEVRSIRRRIEHAPSARDKQVLDRQIGELSTEIARLKERLIPRPPRLSSSALR